MNKESILQYLASNKERFHKKYSVVKIGLFGSYARGNEKEESDIDIAVEIEAGNTYRSFFSLKRELEHNLGSKVDLGIESTLKPIARKYISKEIIYA